MKLGLLCSGNLGLHVLEKLKNKTIIFVATDSKSIDIIEYCKSNNIPLFIGNPRNKKLKFFIKELEVDIIVSINYLFLIEKDIIEHPKICTFNIHGSLLPKYRGRTPHVWAIINGEKECGITAHLIDEGCDTGEILAQKIIPIEEHDTGQDVLNKYKESYLPLVESVLDGLINGTIDSIKQEEVRSTYFGKRTPEDGHICWDWHAERIRNWVRAQAYPYPGSFSFYQNKKLIIDKVEISDLGYNDEIPNGQILRIENGKVYVKCPNRVLLLTEIRNFREFKFKIKENLK